MARPTGDSARVWLWMMKEGGRHAPPEIVKGCGLLDPAAASTLLTGMVNSGAAVRYQTEGKRGSRYGVTPGCKVPHGVTVRELMDAALAEAAA